MADFPQLQNTGNLQEYIRGIPSRGVPEKVTHQHLESLGYKSKNDRPIANVLRFIGVLDSNTAPTPLYAKLRNKQKAPTELAVMIKKAYSTLYATYPDANKKDAETLKTWFASHTTVGEASVKNMTQTFTSLCSLADFDGDSVSSDAGNGEDQIDEKEKSGSPKGKTRKRGSLDTQVAFNIQIQIPGDQPPEVYESIFKNLGKYVLGVTDDD